MKKTAIVRLQIPSKGIKKDVELPLNIAAERVIAAIAEAYQLGTPATCLFCEDPIAMVSGKMSVGEFGMHDGTTVKYIV